VESDEASYGQQPRRQNQTASSGIRLVASGEVLVSAVLSEVRVVIRNMIVHVDAEKASGSDWFPTLPHPGAG